MDQFGYVKIANNHYCEDKRFYYEDLNLFGSDFPLLAAGFFMFPCI